MDALKDYIQPEYFDAFMKAMYLFLPKLILGVVLLIVGFYVIRVTMRALGFALDRRDLDPALKHFLQSLASVLLKVLLIVSVASTIGIATTSFITVLGTIGLAIGMALQGSLGNFAGSVLIMVFKPFEIDDYIRAQGEEGRVVNINIFTTTLLTFSNLTVVIPNGPLAGGVIVNITAQGYRRLELKVRIAYSDKIEDARKALLKVVEGDQRILDEPMKPQVFFMGFGDSALDLQLRMWVNNDDYWSCYYEFLEEMKIQLDKSGITIPFPQRDLHFLTSLQTSESSSPSTV